ncbi:MAG: sugar O-acetyltransferase [Oscillospiraceae bacterium]
MTQKEKMLAGELYIADDPELTADYQRAQELLMQLNSAITHTERCLLAKKLFGSTGENLIVQVGFHCDYGTNIHVGENFYANFNCTILDGNTVTIGDNCLLGPNVSIYTAGHSTDAKLRAAGLEFAKAVKIGNNCWLGGGVIVNPGVTIGNNVVVASGSVVVKDVPDNVLVGGNPSRIIKII